MAESVLLVPPVDEAWKAAMNLLSEVLKRAECPPVIVGNLEGELNAHKLQRMRARAEAVPERRNIA